MRLPDRERTSKTKVSSPLVAGSVDSNDSDPIDISRSSGSATSFSDVSFTSPTASFNRSYSHRSLAGSLASSYGRRQSVSRSVGSFVGSYEESILSGRMSANPSKPLDFTASIGVLGRGKCKASLKCPPHLTVPFPAYFYSETSPYVGQIDVETFDEGKGGSSNSSSSKHGYRIPAEGQLQVIIKNPNKTAVKLFLIPYNVSDMPALSKTFLRQKHYDGGDGDKLRYAIHIQISSPAQGKYYVHKSQRVVFANRVPDGKEKLRIVVQGPTPVYTPWVPEKRQKKADQHSRPDSKEPRFIGGSLLDGDHDITERSDEQDHSRNYFELSSRQSTPRPYLMPRSPSFQSRRINDMRSSSGLSLGNTTHQESVDRKSGVYPHAGNTNSGGMLAERLKALALARE